MTDNAARSAPQQTVHLLGRNVPVVEQKGSQYALDHGHISTIADGTRLEPLCVSGAGEGGGQALPAGLCDNWVPGVTSPLRRRLAYLELLANAAARPPAFVRYLLLDGTIETVTNIPPGARFILGVREAESTEAWLRDYPASELALGQ